VPVTKEQKEQAKEFLDLIKKSKGSLKVYFAAGKGSDGPGVHVDKKKPKVCVAALKANRITTILASGQLKFEDQLTLYCLKDANDNAVRKAFFQFFKECEVSIPGVTESKILVLGPKEWDSAAEDEDAQAPPPAGAAVSTTAAPPPPPPPPDQSAALMVEYKKLVPEMNSARAELKEPLTKAARAFQEQMGSGAFDNARKALAEIRKLLSTAPAPAAAAAPKQDGNELVAAYKKLVPEMTRKVTENAALKEPLTRAAKQFEDAMKSGKFDDAKGLLDQITQLLATKGAEAAAPKPDGLGAEFAKRYEALRPRLEQAIREGRGDTSKMRAGTQFAVEAANEKEFAKALKAIEQLEKLVDAASASGPAVAPGLVAYRRTLLEFDGAKKTIFANIDALKKKIPSELPDEADFADRLAEELHDMLEEIDDAVVDAMNAAQDEAEPVTPAVKASITNALTQLQSSPLVKHVDGNPFGVNTAIESTLGAALNKVTKAMPAMA
jgi:hypothetical protein